MSIKTTLITWHSTCHANIFWFMREFDDMMMVMVMVMVMMMHHIFHACAMVMGTSWDTHGESWAISETLRTWKHVHRCPWVHLTPIDCLLLWWIMLVLRSKYGPQILGPILSLLTSYFTAINYKKPQFDHSMTSWWSA